MFWPHYVAFMALILNGLTLFPLHILATFCGLHDLEDVLNLNPTMFVYTLAAMMLDVQLDRKKIS